MRDTPEREIPSPSPSTQSLRDPRRALTLQLLRRTLPQDRTFDVRLWDGTLLPAPQGSADATLVLREPDALGQMLELPLDLALGEAYLRGAFDIEGRLERVFEVIEDFTPRFTPLDLVALTRDAAALRARVARAPSPLAARLRGRAHSRERDRQAISHHYDVSSKFYQLWLDARMVYSCAYFPDGHETLDEAQEAKLDLICRKLRLRNGEQLLDIGSGWGGLALHAAERYGARVLGVTLSERQLQEARARARAAGMEDRVRFELLDYRDVTGEFDKVASVGMSEHVGSGHLAAYFKLAYARLRPGGLMLNHAISRGPVTLSFAPGTVSGDFVRRYVFPDGEIVPLWRTLETAESAGFEVRDVEDLREHYATTLRHWLDRLERAWEAAVAEVSAARARLWRLYLAGSAHQFAHGHLAVHQALLAKPGERARVDLPPSRADLYRAAN